MGLSIEAFHLNIDNLSVNENNSHLERLEVVLADEIIRSKTAG
jgi:hypothetical protein